MKPIINPLLFYFIDTICSLKEVLMILFGIAFTIYILYGFLSIVGDEEYPKWFKTNRTIILLIPFLIGVFIPSRETAYKMVISSYITPNNIEIVKDTGKDLIDYIIEKAGELESVKQK